MKKVFVLLILMSANQLAFSQGLVKFVINESRYVLLPKERLMAFDINTKKNRMTITLDNHGANIWQVRIDDLPEKSALKLIDQIYSSTRKEPLEIRVSDKN
ncbi:Uncharacterised protein [BD1-7 clade bacterium]|uniref:Uncharacterized protein n=1 Tax=BD1-7 clade bacterium TaxID=2029982 RepID=A0A5S9QGI4_9GAMM|nr:Uncharacterised protein [BD1-7 clade bacterium]CAA0118026.1 Uncharacterised protein [BD1-7 clade bacterium]